MNLTTTNKTFRLNKSGKITFSEIQFYKLNLSESVIHNTKLNIDQNAI